MKEIDIKRHSFELAKNRLKEFSEKTEAELAIDKVKIDGGFLGLGDHKVRGYELNNRLETIQNHFISVNTTNNKVIKEFREIYNALDALDKDYIKSIICNLKVIEKTSNDVRIQQETLKKHNEKLATQQRKLDTHQVEIESNVENISKIVKILKDFKKKLEEYKHLTDIDKIWNDCKSIQKEIKVVSDSIIKFSNKTTEDIKEANNKNKSLSEQINRDIPILRKDLDNCKSNIEKINSRIKEHQNDLATLTRTSAKHKENIETICKNIEDIEKYAIDSRNLINELVDFTNEVKSLKHLMEIDFICEKTKENEISIQQVEGEVKIHTDKLNELQQENGNMHESINLSVKEISILKSSMGQLSSISHLYDVDDIWRDVKEHTSKIIECEKKDENLVAIIKKNKEEFNENIAETTQIMSVSIESLMKKVKYAYWIAGGSMVLAIIELILLFMKVI